MPQTNVGIVGCGVISGIYLDNITSRFKGVKALSCADMDSSKSAASASKYGLKQESVSELLANPDIDVVLNLTTPLSHKEISISALRAGKHVFSEKPLGATFAEASEIIDEADRLGLRVGCAPDTILGAGLQTAFEAVRSGSVGDPVAASAFFFCPGHELWHENPAFYYLPGGGPVLDMGPYYFTALVSALGPAKRVCAMSRRSGERTVHRGQLKGQSIPVEVDTHSSAIIEFESGVIATCMLSFDIWAAKLPRIEIYCSAGTILLPDPNTFGGPVLARGQSGDFAELPVTGPFQANSRGLGLAEMCWAIRNGEPHRASGNMALHVMEILSGMEESAKSGEFVSLKSAFSVPVPLPAGIEEEL